MSKYTVTAVCTAEFTFDTDSYPDEFDPLSATNTNQICSFIRNLLNDNGVYEYDDVPSVGEITIKSLPLPKVEKSAT